MTKGAYLRRRALGKPVREAAVHRLGAKDGSLEALGLEGHEALWSGRWPRP